MSALLKVTFWSTRVSSSWLHSLYHKKNDFMVFQWSSFRLRFLYTGPRALERLSQWQEAKLQPSTTRINPNLLIEIWSQLYWLVYESKSSLLIGLENNEILKSKKRNIFKKCKTFLRKYRFLEYIFLATLQLLARIHQRTIQTKWIQQILHTPSLKQEIGNTSQFNCLVCSTNRFTYVRPN